MCYPCQDRYLVSLAVPLLDVVKGMVPSLVLAYLRLPSSLHALDVVDESEPYPSRHHQQVEADAFVLDPYPKLRLKHGTVGALDNHKVPVVVVEEAEEASYHVPVPIDGDEDDGAGEEEQEVVAAVVDGIAYYDASYQVADQNSSTWNFHRDIRADVAEAPIPVDVGHNRVQENVDDGKGSAGQILSLLHGDEQLDELV